MIPRAGAGASRVGAVLLALAFAHLGTAVTAEAADRVEWRSWGREAFDEARVRHKLVLLDLTAGWCHWCRVMAEESYADSSVVAEIAAGFVPVRVDYDARPDIGDRYVTNGWPTTAVLSPNGQLLLAKTYLPPPALREFLKEASMFYRVNRQQVERKSADAEKAVARTWAPDSLLPPSLSDEEYVARNLLALRDLEDKEHGGFGSAPKTPRWDAISFLLRAADARGDDEPRALAVRATAAALSLQDSLDGGIFRFALEPDWTKLRYERLLEQQASALSILSRAGRATGEARFDRAAARVAAFMESLLVVPSDAGRSSASRPAWRSSLAPDVRLRDGRWMDGEIYYRLSRASRRGQGMPARSPLVTLDAGARAVSALLAWGERGGAPRDPVGRLERLATRLARGDGSYYHAASPTARTAPGLLADHAALGHAFLDAYRASADPLWLARADSLAGWMRANLWDASGEGFRFAPRDTSAIGRLKAGDKPEGANAEAGAFFLRLYWLTGKAEDRTIAERTAHYLQSGDKIVLDPARAELVVRLHQEPLRLLVVGPRRGGGAATKRAETLRAAARNAPVPEVVVRYLDAPPAARGAIGWPDAPPAGALTPAIYRWSDTGWRGPVTDPAKLGDLLEKSATAP